MFCSILYITRKCKSIFFVAYYQDKFNINTVYSVFAVSFLESLTNPFLMCDMVDGADGTKLPD